MSVVSPNNLSKIKQGIDHVIIARRNPHTGLFPASTAVTEHGDYSDAWVRDNLYTLVSIFGLRQHFRQQSDGSADAQYYGDIVVKTMRGLLQAMMKQSSKVERFKVTHHPMDALHAKYDTETGDIVVGDDQWGHLQIDATSLYLLSLAQMSQAGLKIIQREDERDFIQNLIYYIAKGYQVPDFGIWERGNKINNGTRELHASSIGMVKSALVAMNMTPFYLFDQAEPHYFYVNDDEIARCRMTLEQLLPRESLSKEVDAACLSITGYPAFAIESITLRDKTEHKIRHSLLGVYGCKRFLLDGHQTPLEDKHRLHYNNQELKNFEHIECEWPLFLVYEYVTALMRQQHDVAADYKQRIEKILVEQDGYALLPELYQLQAHQLDAEKKKPGSQAREPNANMPLVWAQSLYYLGLLLEGGWISSDDIDPIGIRQSNKADQSVVINVVVIAETQAVCDALSRMGIIAETLDTIAPAQVISAEQFSTLHRATGANETIQMTGAPQTIPRPMETAIAYRSNGITNVVQSNIQNADSYLSYDVELMIENLRADWQYIARHWRSACSPLSVVWVTEAHVVEQNIGILKSLVGALNTGAESGLVLHSTALKDALQHALVKDVVLPQSVALLKFSGVAVADWVLPFDASKTAPLPESVLSFLEPMRSEEALTAVLFNSPNLYEQLDTVEQLLVTFDMAYKIAALPGNPTLKIVVQEIYQRATENRIWGVVRKSAALLDRYFNGLEDAVAEILARQKILYAGRSFDAIGQISQPMSNDGLVEILKKNTGYDEREGVINQEIIVFLALLLRYDPHVFSGIVTLRSGQLLQLILSRLARKNDVGAPETFDLLCDLPPARLLKNVRRVVINFDRYSEKLIASEGLMVQPKSVVNSLDRGNIIPLESESAQLGDAADWFQWREIQGLMPRLSDAYYVGLWDLLERSRGLVLGNRFDRKTRMNSDIVLGSMTPGEGQFIRLFEKMLSQIESPSYRQMTIEALFGMMQYLIVNSALSLRSYLTVEVILGHAVRLNWLQHFPEDADRYNDVRGKAWRQFYLESPETVSQRVGDAMAFLIATGQEQSLDEDNEDANSIH